MSKAMERCPHCVIVPMVARTNGWGGAYLECMDCGYSESIRRQADPFPTVIRVSKYADGRTRVLKSKKQPGKKYGKRRAA